MELRICDKCKNELLVRKIRANYDICYKCGNYLRVHARRRIEMLADKDTFVEWDANVGFITSLDDEYTKKHAMTSEKYNLKEAIITGEMDMEGQHIAIGVMDTRFMMASMGQVVGEKVTRLFEKAIRKKLPVILFCCSGGARMQEGIISLMQMEKTSQAVKKHSDAKLLYISVLTNPTMGGVTASFALNADVILAEREAVVGFAGKRVLEQIMGVKFSEGFQKAENQIKNGFIDAIVEREKLRDIIVDILQCHTKKQKHVVLHKKRINRCAVDYKESSDTAWEKVIIARSNNRPTCKEFVNRLFNKFILLSGDRINGEDSAILTGIAKFHNIPVTVIGQQKGKGSIEEAIYYNWGMASPAGYRKALRIMKQAEKFKRPIICFIDTIGAACTQEAEEDGQAMAIAKLLGEISAIQVPILSIIISEGNSGGALALGVGNKVWMLENAVYAILSPEAYASILWKDKSRREEAANRMRMTAKDLYEIGIVDKIIREGEPVTTANMEELCTRLEDDILAFIEKYKKMSAKRIVKERYKRFRKY